ncbi:MAG: PEFG-CTERM sorting domain-containing protein [Thaumarchaeota archaeon]|nr:MAG: PEFG-CTERM sorting domain-containing protein [Nitrososphaerota archaeon]
MMSKTIDMFIIVLTLTIGIMTFTPSVFADITVTITKGSGDSQNPACVATNNCFTPNPVNVSPGETVTWTNTDTAPNSVTSGIPTPDNSTGSIFDSGFLGPGKTFSHTFTAADVGTISYFSEIHPWMTGQVIVAASTTTTNPTADNNTGTPEFGPVASLVLVIAVISVVAVTAKTRGFLKL